MDEPEIHTQKSRFIAFYVIIISWIETETSNETFSGKKNKQTNERTELNNLLNQPSDELMGP